MDKKIQIINILEEHKRGVHLRELSRILKTGMTNILRYVNILEKENVIKKKKEANLVLVQLKEGVRTISYLKQVNSERFLALPKNIQTTINDFLYELEEKPIIALIFGSYAKDNYVASSDIDLFLVYQRIENNKDIDNTARRISMRSNKQINPIYVDYKSFKKNFLDKHHDFSKEIREKVILLSGVEDYYGLLWRFLE